MATKRTHDGDVTAPAAKRVAAADVKGRVALAVGINCFGQLGLTDSISERKKPALLRLGSLEGMRAAAVAAGGMHSVIVASDGTVHTFGCNDEGALGRSGDENVPALAEGLEDGGVFAIAASAGDSHSAVLTRCGRVFATGCFRDDDGSLAFSPQAAVQRTFTQVYPVVGAKPSKKAGSEVSVYVSFLRIFGSGKGGRASKDRRW